MQVWMNLNEKSQIQQVIQHMNHSYLILQKAKPKDRKQQLPMAGDRERIGYNGAQGNPLEQEKYLNYGVYNCKYGVHDYP